MANLRLELKAELEAAGLLSYQPAKVYGKFLFLMAIVLSLYSGFFLATSWWLKVPLFIAAVTCNVAVVMLGHESGHGAVSRRPFINDLLGYLTFPLMAGLSMTYWKHKHNTLHHSYPNVAGKDGDLDLHPFAVYTEQKNAAKFPLIRFIQRYQGLFFWPLTLLLGFGMRRDSVVFLFGYGRKLSRGLPRYIDLCCMALHYFLWLAAPTLFFGIAFSHALLFYVCWTLVVGIELAAIFVPAHMTQPLYRNYDENFILQLQTTQNLKTNKVFSYLMIGLDHQVEHHLFQRMSHLEVDAAEPIVRAFCVRHKLPYQEEGWGSSLWSVTRAIDRLPDYELVDRPPAL